VLINGGTGISTRDTTYEAISGILQKRLDGFGELFRMLSFEEIGSKAMATRAVAGVHARTLIFSMPGSIRAVKLAMEKLVAPELGHLLGELRK
jgi:molybdenum cofactor biosynthesis protein B